MQVPLSNFEREPRKVILPAYLPYEIDLQITTLKDSRKSTWEIFGREQPPARGQTRSLGDVQKTSRRRPGDAKRRSRDAQETSRDPKRPQDPPGDEHRKLPSKAPSRAPSKDPSNTHSKSPRQTAPIYHFLSGVKLPIARPWRPVCYYSGSML